jgi:putative SOS response-associated peptidase YedK
VEGRRKADNGSKGVSEATEVLFCCRSYYSSVSNPYLLSYATSRWGLVTKSGSQRNPLPSDSEDSKARMALHFQNLMFNARSDTLFSKPTFSRLLSQSKSCVVALDGYFEWKSSPLAGGKGKKQPYFVHRKVSDATPKQSYLLMAGLWTRVSTGIPEEPTLDTFTMLTTGTFSASFLLCLLKTSIRVKNSSCFLGLKL